MSSLPLPRHAQAPNPKLPTTSACLLRPRGRLLLGENLSASSPHASSLHLASVAAPSPRASVRRPGGGGGLLLLSVAASAAAISASFIFFSAIPSMLECKKAAESLEKSFDLTREKLPETMASVRLVGKEIGDLSVVLSDLSQELTKVVRSSLSIVHTADAQLRQLATSAQQGTTQGVANRKKAVGEPLVATTVREVRELIADIRSGFGAAFGITSLFMWASKIWSKRPKEN
ncbi:uncharacterized protein LOC123407857 [Hordeum vulgare subsp. vulgare]|uniref:Uncharacterized protein n=1 Tax=Hordeum vulgare subsp. vulgare TaxID=112509 RepID=A0A8I6YKI7_HORVV|nr:uncharacterized protein LOC123407857 [Hordeum vulgare subsp. vulgare]